MSNDLPPLSGLVDASGEPGIMDYTESPEGQAAIAEAEEAARCEAEPLDGRIVELIAAASNASGFLAALGGQDALSDRLWRAVTAITQPTTAAVPSSPAQPKC